MRAHVRVRVVGGFTLSRRIRPQAENSANATNRRVRRWTLKPAAKAVAAQQLSTSAGIVEFTVSIGVAHTGGSQEPSPQELFEAADRALYTSKDAGRNRVSIAPDSE